jgi:hypothetical protein
MTAVEKVAMLLIVFSSSLTLQQNKLERFLMASIIFESKARAYPD